MEENKEQSALRISLCSNLCPNLLTECRPIEGIVIKKVKIYEIWINKEYFMNGLPLLQARVLLTYSSGSESIVTATIDSTDTNGSEESSILLKWINGSYVMSKYEAMESSFYEALSYIIGQSPTDHHIRTLTLKTLLAEMERTIKMPIAQSCSPHPRRDRDHKQEYYRRQFHGRGRK